MIFLIFLKIFSERFSTNLIKQHCSPILFETIAASTINIQFILYFFIHFLVEFIHIDLGISDPNSLAYSQQPL